MNTKKKMVLGAAFVVAVIALAGVGYALTTNFTGETSTTNAKKVDVDYVSIALSATNYTDTVISKDVAHIYWTTVTSYDADLAKVKTVYTYDTTHSVATYTYNVNIDTSSLEETDRLQLTIGGFGSVPDGYTLTAVWDSSATPLDISTGTATISEDVISAYTGNHTLVLTLAPTSTSVTVYEGSGTTAPSTNVTFPALTFTLSGENIAVPSA